MDQPTPNNAVRYDVGAIATVEEYFDRSDWRVNTNVDQSYSPGGLILNTTDKVAVDYWLERVYTPQIGEARRRGDYHIHDLDVSAGYCAGWFLKRLIQEGFNGVPGATASAPSAYLSSVCGQVVSFLGTLQNEWAGVQAFFSFNTYMTPFVCLDNMSHKQIAQNMQELIYNLNVLLRWGSQYPFTNLIFDWTCSDDLRDKYPLIVDEVCDFTHGELQHETDFINKAFIEVMTHGDAGGRVFTFLIPTYNITPDFNWDSENTDLPFDMIAKYGLPYFQNFINSDLDPHMIRSMYCRLQLDLRELLKRDNDLFGLVELTGSIGVVTMNMARLGYRFAGDEGALVTKLDRLIDLVSDSFECKREVIQFHMDHGLSPYSKRYLGHLDNHFSTIGVNGMNEMVRNFTHNEHDLADPRGFDICVRIPDHVREHMVELQEKTGHLYDFEATPVEGTTYRLAKEDRKCYPGILQAETEEQPYYMNSSQLPVGYTDNPFQAPEDQEVLQGKYTGSMVLHLYTGERMSSGAAYKEMVKRSLTAFKLPYITITPAFSICPVHGYLAGEHFECPKCQEAHPEREPQACEVRARVMGYFHPVQSFNTGKKGEYAECQMFSEEAAGQHGELVFAFPPVDQR